MSTLNPNLSKLGPLNDAEVLKSLEIFHNLM